jgi:hypothetical protein
VCVRLDVLGRLPGPELLHVLTLPDLELAERIGEFWGYPRAGCARSIFERLRRPISG